MLGKGLGLLEALGEHPDGVGASELARELGMPVSTVHRLLSSMVPSGFVSTDAGRGRYSLGLRVFELSQRVARARELTGIASPVLRRVAEDSEEPAFLAVLDGIDIVYVVRADGRHRLQIRGEVGERGPLHCTSMGKAILAFMPDAEREDILGRLELRRVTPKTITDPKALRTELQRTKQRGYSVADEERDEGVRAVGAPVLDLGGWPVAAISVAGPITRVSEEKVSALAPLIREAAREIGVQLPPNAARRSGTRGHDARRSA